MIISKGSLDYNALKGQVAVVTGAGRGIGFEAARALVWLGANVIIAEIDEKTGKNAEETLNKEFGEGKALFVKVDIGSEKDIDSLAEAAAKRFSKVDIVLNNATIFPMGAVKDTPINSWDASYRVNLRGPVLLARKFLPDMLSRNCGVFVCISSSGAAPFMGPYEVFKTAQVELSNTLSAELEGSGVYTFTIGPGISRTPGFAEGGAKVAKYMGMTVDELFALNKNAQISPEAAGAGFAIAIALAKKYNGQEISSIQVLREANIPFAKNEGLMQTQEILKESPQITEPIAKKSEDVLELYSRVSKTYREQSEGWKKRNLFERQWVARDFKKTSGMSIDEMQTAMKALGDCLKKGAQTKEYVEPIEKLVAYYSHQQEQLRGFEKNPEKLASNLKIIDSWISDGKSLLNALNLSRT